MKPALCAKRHTHTYAVSRINRSKIFAPGLSQTGVSCIDIQSLLSFTELFTELDNVHLHVRVMFFEILLLPSKFPVSAPEEQSTHLITHTDP